MLWPKPTGHERAKMKTVSVVVAPGRDGEQVTVCMRIEKKRGITWRHKNETQFCSGHGGAERKIRLEDDERLIIEGVADTEAYFDKEQNAFVQRPKPRVDEPVRSDPEKDDYL